MISLCARADRAANRVGWVFEIKNVSRDVRPCAPGNAVCPMGKPVLVSFYQ